MSKTLQLGASKEKNYFFSDIFFFFIKYKIKNK